MNMFYLKLLTVFENKLKANKNKLDVKYSKKLSLIYSSVHLARSSFFRIRELNRTFSKLSN